MSKVIQGAFGASKQIDNPSELEGERKNRAERLLSLLLEETAPKESEGYHMAQVHTTVNQLDTVPDILNGQTRNKRWGAMLSIAVIPGLDKVPVGPVTIPATPFSFYDADSLEKMKERLVFEIDKAVETARLSEEDPEAFMYVQQEFRSRLQKAMSDKVPK